MAELSDEAKAAIADAVKIVREDRAEKFYREMRDHFKGVQPPTTEPPVDPNKPVPPPVKDKPEDKTTDKPKKRGLWWNPEDDEPTIEPPKEN